MQFIQFQSQDPNSLNTPSAGSFNVFIDQTDNTLKVKDQAGDVYGGGGGGGFTNITYSGLVNSITTSGLTAGGFYLITDFRTCYDQPDFNFSGSSITTGNYKQSAIEPIMVFATSVSTISIDAYQPAYPNDKIQYDWTYSATEVTNDVAYGRISERIDEFNNRTDYDHRTILFKRYRLYTHRQDQRLNGTIELFSDGLVEGNNTSFESLSVGDVIYVPSVTPSFYEITGITNNFEMFVSGDTISTDGSGLQFYKAIDENNGEGGYFSYKRTNVKTDDFIEYTTFGNVIVFDNFAKNNYVGNYANNYTNISNGDFILANNVFLEGSYESNKFGDSCYDNTFGTDNQNNTWGNHCYRNVSTNDIDDNIIGHYFHDNLINANLQNNHIGNNFNDNRLLSENGEAFEDNIIGNNFNGNTIYSRFYKNEILDNFNSNTIGDFGNLDNLEFYRNYIRNNFNNNIIRRDFQNNQIGTNFQQNTTNGEFIGNTILNGYNNNTIGNYFGLNNIGNGFNGNTVYDNFYSNTTDYYFYSNVISNDFYKNDVRTYFYNNEPTNLNLFSWNNTSIENLTGRTYNTFYQSLDNNFDYILGKELIMHDTVNDEYHKVKFTQWTQNGGGFSYERTKVYPTVESTVSFTKTNNGNEIDIIVEGSLEITRGNNGGIYNTADEGSWNQNQSPVGTEWNSIYTQENNGERFIYNKIGHNFQDNTIGSYFGYDYNNAEDENGNKIGDNFRDNNVVSTMYGNVIGNNFNNNDIYSRFYDNQIGNKFENNDITDFGNLDNFQFYNNVIGNDFNQNIIRQNFNDNKIGNDFDSNVVNGNFYQNFIGNLFQSNPNIGYNFGGNRIGNNFNSNDVIGDYFTGNTIGEYFESNNNISYNFKNNQIGNIFENNTLGNTDNFNWDNTNIENLTGRTYDTFYQSLNESIDNLILSKELIMRFSRNSGTTITSGDLVVDETYEITNYLGDDDFSNVADVISGDINTNGCIFIATGTTPTEWSSNSELTELTSYDEYHKVKFTQWTQDGNGGGFSYERTKVYPSVESTVSFTKTNSVNDVDVIVEGRLEITRDDNGAIYNAADEVSWDSNQSPIGTEWNSIYTQENNNNGYGFQDNIIDNEFKGNLIINSFAGNYVKSYVGGNEFSGNVYSNQIGSFTYDNQFLGEFVDNTWQDNFYTNIIGDSFNKNTFETNIGNNTIANNFQSNQIGNNFEDNTIGQDFFGNTIGQNFYDNTIGNGFQTNQIGSYFNTNTIADYFGYGYGAPQGNKIGSNFYNNTIGEYFYNNTIPDNFTENTIGNYFQWNIVNTSIDSTDFTPNYGNITGFTYTATGTSATDDIYTGLSGVTTSEFGVNATFDIEVSGGTVIGVSGNTEGKLYVTGDTITILGTQIGGVIGVIDGFSSDAVGKSGTTGSYTGITASGTGGENATFDIDVADDVVTDIYLNNGGVSYSINETLTIVGSDFGGVDGVDDITITVNSLYSDNIVITVSGVTIPSVYEHYTCQLFERQGGAKRLSFYDENDILTITNIDE